jgi:hypothetical protein
MYLKGIENNEYSGEINPPNTLCMTHASELRHEQSIQLMHENIRELLNVVFDF